MGDATHTRGYRITGPATELFHATRHPGEWGWEGDGGSASAKQIDIWEVRPQLCRQPGTTALAAEDLNRAADLGSGLVTQILGIWTDDAALTFATEHVSGLSLADVTFRLAARNARLPLPAVLSALLEVCRALQTAHDALGGPVVHGDLRPEWVILSYEGLIKLTGFGFARFLPVVSPDGSWSAFGGRCYQPPERLLADAATGRALPTPQADIYAMGAVLLEAATGELPYGTRDPRKLVALLQGGDPLPAVSQQCPKLLHDVIARACALHPEERHQDVETLAAELHGLLLDLSVPGFRPELMREALAAASPHAVGQHEARRIHAPAAEPRPVSAPEIQRQGGLVGRDAALRVVGQALADTAEGKGQALQLVGEQGMGRTQMLKEARTRLQEAGHSVVWLQVCTEPAEQAVSYSAALRLLAAAAGVRPGQNHLDFTGEVDRLRAFGLDASTRASLLGLLGSGEAPSPEQGASLMSHTLIRCVSSLAWEQPTVVAWDDLQWTDTASLGCLEALLDQIALMPVVVLLTAPRSFEISWAVAPPMKLTLGPLSHSECRQLVLARVPGTHQVDEDLLQLLGEHTGGNPLLIEETLELLRQVEEIEIVAGRLRYSGTATKTLPDFEGIVRARLQALPPEHSVTLIAAALAGPALGEDVLSAATGILPAETWEILETLTDEHGLLREGGAGDWAFPHERLRKAVLASVNTSALPGLAGRVARAITERRGDLSTSTADHLAGLFDLGGDPVAAADLLETAASRQERRGDLRGAAERYDRALSLLAAAGSVDLQRELALRMRVGRAALKGLRLRLGKRALDEAVVLADRLEDLPAGAEARLLLSRLLSRQGRLDEAMDWAEQAVPLAEQSEDRGLLAQVYAAIAESHQQRGLYGPDLKYITAGLATATEAGDALRVGECLQLAVMHAGAVGRFDETWQYMERARTIADETDDPALSCQLLRLEATLHLMMGDSERSLQTNLQGIARAREHGLAEAEIVMLHNAGDNHLHLDRMREALYCFSESLRRSKAIHFDRLSEANEMYIGFLEAAYLGAATGFDRLRRAIETEEKVGRLWNLNQGHQLLGRALMAHGDHEAALEHLKEALRLAERTGVRYFIDEANDWLQRAGAASE